MDDQRQELIRQMEELWQFGSRPPQGGLASRLAQRVLLRLLGPLFAQQRDFNAAAVKLIYLLTSRVDTLVSQHSALAAHIVTIQESLNLLYRNIHSLEQGIYLLGNHDGELNDRLTRLVYTTQLLDNAVAEADSAHAEIATQFAALSMRLDQSGQGSERHE